jgi:SAM-dependent methyltransferase
MGRWTEETLMYEQNVRSATLPWRCVQAATAFSSSPALVQHRPCPVCGALDEHTVLLFDDFQFYSDSQELPKRVPVRVVRCAQCFALFLNPCYSETGFGILFAEAGQSYGASEGRPAEQIAWLAERGLLAPGLAILDAGCYDGRFLSLLPASLRRLGVDIDEPAILRGRRAYGDSGVELICGDFEGFATPVPPDVITMFHVLEHLPRPVAVLSHLRRVAHSGTRLIVEVPVIEHGLTNDINGFLSVQHMTHFSRRSLANALDRGGWKILELRQSAKYNGCRIVAEPGPTASAVRGDAADTQLLQKYLSHWYGNLAQVHSRLSGMNIPERLFFWGGGLHTEFLYHVTSLFGSAPERKYLIVDSDAIKQGKSWRGVPILAPDAVAAADWNVSALLVSSYGSQEAIATGALALGVPEARLLRLYDHIARY